MASKKQSYIKGTFTHRRTEADYMGVLLDAVPLEDWREVVSATVAAAKAGDATARAWLAQYLVGKPGATAPAPLTVVVQQLSGRDPLVERLAKPHIDRAKYPLFSTDDDFEDAMTRANRGRIGGGRLGGGFSLVVTAITSPTPVHARRQVDVLVRRADRLGRG